MSQNLKSARATVIIDPDDGGRLTSLILDRRELIGAGVPHPESPEGWYHGAFPMAPYAGRLKHGEFRFDGATHRISPNAGRHAGHGLVFDVPWSVVSPSLGGSSLVLATDLDDRWPFGGRVTQTFDLDSTGLVVTLQLSNDQRPMPGALGFHPWFRRDIGTGPATYRFNPRRRYAPDSDGFGRTSCTDLGDRPWDDVFDVLDDDPRISWPDASSVHIKSATDTWILYERQADAVCIEPLTAPPDSLGTERASIVRPGEPLQLSMRLDWGPRAHEA